ncbi:hypothetical protein F4054_00345 [Candidatus Poribacteria bacterium]|nr:hypothetical protein [Candidatus Poribacteria bacterium]MYG05287.1 hypothetical protein [Candidatus Poribacteria bacterium]MYK20694.1 hypothetical protein [Candidatus Poribacteria bacterium]
MKQHLFFFKEVRHALLSGSSYSTVRACVAFLVFLLLSINCGTPPQSQYHVPESAITAAEKTMRPQSTQNSASLPESATVQLEKMPYVRNAFKERVRVSSRGGLNDFHASSRAQVQHSAVISNCSFDVLKAFIAKGWAPIVMIEFQGRTPEILPISHYNEQLGEVLLENPSNRNKRRLTYKDFEMSWSRISRNKCVLITPQRLTEMDIQKVLGSYLPTEAFQQIRVQSR